MMPPNAAAEGRAFVSAPDGTEREIIGPARRELAQYLLDALPGSHVSFTPNGGSLMFLDAVMPDGYAALGYTPAEAATILACVVQVGTYPAGVRIYPVKTVDMLAAASAHFADVRLRYLRAHYRGVVDTPLDAG